MIRHLLTAILVALPAFTVAQDPVTVDEASLLLRIGVPAREVTDLLDRRGAAAPGDPASLRALEGAPEEIRMPFEGAAAAAVRIEGLARRFEVFRAPGGPALLVPAGWRSTVEAGEPGGPRIILVQAQGATAPGGFSPERLFVWVDAAAGLPAEASAEIAETIARATLRRMAACGLEAVEAGRSDRLLAGAAASLIEIETSDPVRGVRGSIAIHLRILPGGGLLCCGWIAPAEEAALMRRLHEPMAEHLEWAAANPVGR